VNVTRRQVAYALCSAFEGGSNYWYRIEDFIKPPKVEFQMSKDRVYRHTDYALNPGGALAVSDYKGVDGDKMSMTVRRLDLDTIKKGLELMAKEHPRHFGDLVSEGGDACTGDVLLQCCLFGKLVYG
jgi:hypothetical protein